jgi:DNA replication protein DnaC
MNPLNSQLAEHLNYLKLPVIRDHYQSLAAQAAEKQLSHIDYLERLADGEAASRRDRFTQRRIQQVRFPVIKTLDQFNWSRPKKINRLQVKNLFRPQFIPDTANVIFLGGVGIGKTHLATALGYQACLEGHSVLFATAIDVINTLAAAQSAGRMKPSLKNTPALRS